jgi:antitoxin MazE
MWAETMYLHCIYRVGMKTQLAKWGNSLGLRIPRAVVVEANVAEGDEVDVTVEDGAIIVRPAVRRYTLEELIDGITPSNKHKELDWGPPVGKEVW